MNFTDRFLKSIARFHETICVGKDDNGLEKYEEVYADATVHLNPWEIAYYSEAEDDGELFTNVVLKNGDAFLLLMSKAEFEETINRKIG